MCEMIHWPQYAVGPQRILRGGELKKKTEVRSQKSEVRSQKSEVGSVNLTV
jgi:hypothetical protein